MRSLLLVLLTIGLQQPPRFEDTAVIPAFRRAHPGTSSFQTFFKQPTDNAHLLLIVGAGTSLGEQGKVLLWGEGTLIGVFLMDRADANRVWELAILRKDDIGELAVTVERFDDRSLVLAHRNPDYGIHYGFTKLLFDARAKRLIGSVEYSEGDTHILPRRDRLCAETTLGDESVLSCLQDGSPSIVSRAPAPAEPADREPCVAFKLPPLPQSTYDEFAKARPERVREGYVRNGTTIEERAAACQTVGDRVWFGKSFHDGEGLTGVGAIGSFDRRAGTFALISVPELIEWSTSAFLMEGDIAWIGMARSPEGAAYSGGLLRYDLKQRQSSTVPIADVINSIARWDGALYLGTTNGLYVVQDESVRRFRWERGLNRAVVIVPERLPR